MTADEYRAWYGTGPLPSKNERSQLDYSFNTRDVFDGAGRMVRLTRHRERSYRRDRCAQGKHGPIIGALCHRCGVPVALFVAPAAGHYDNAPIGSVDWA